MEVLFKMASPLADGLISYREVKKTGDCIGTVFRSKEIKKSDIDCYVHAGRQIELLQLVYGLDVWFDDVDQPLVSANFELIHGFFVDVRGTVHCVFFNSRGQWYGTTDPGS